MNAPARFISGEIAPQWYLDRIQRAINEICDIEEEFPDWELEEFSRRARLEQGENR